MMLIILISFCIWANVCGGPVLNSSGDCTGGNLFQCKSPQGDCIPKLWVCDRDRDCLDGSDEEDCDKHHKTCNPGDFQCVQQQNCIPARWKCDGQADCLDGSDEAEALCVNHTCDDHQFTCKEDHLVNGKNHPICIPLHWKCDGQRDCPKASDEAECPTPRCSASLQFQCGSDGPCIFARWKCDHDRDCEDGSDEENCEFPACDPKKQFTCETDRRCIPAHWRCDGDRDCRDTSDELNCPRTNNTMRPCHEDHEWRCNDGRCILQNWKCDGAFDCEDKSDETECAAVSCLADQFKCNGTGGCIPATEKCDGRPQCEDGSDELGCVTVAPVMPCTSMQFECAKGSCIPLEQLCDGKQQCPDGQDEAPKYDCPDSKKVKKCGTSDLGCNHLCKDTPTGPVCVCRPGYQLKPGSKTFCDDIDECNTDDKTTESPPVCSHKCFNTPGSYYCKCEENYLLHPDMHSCRAIGNHPKLLVSNRLDIRTLDLINQEFTPLMAANMESTVAMDYMIKDQIVVWSDVSKEKIYKCHLNTMPEGSTDCSEELVGEGVDTPDGIAVDWVHSLLYWTDTGLDTVSVMDMNTKHRKTLFNDKLQEPRAIVVYPAKGVMFWTDWGLQPKIERAGMDGTHRVTIVSKDILWPNGIAIDYIQERLYWADAKLRQLSSCDFNGKHINVVVDNWAHLKHPFSVAVFEDKVYWTDWETEGVHEADKFTGKNASVILHGLSGLMTVKVYHDVLQPNVINKCQGNRCAHLCLPSLNKAFVTEMDYKPLSHQCHCSDNYTRLEDELNCFIEVDSGGSSDTAAIAQPGPTGRIAGTVFGFLLIVSMVLALVGWLVYRELRHRAPSRAFSFDNPVYRKTTEDVSSAETAQYHPAASYPPTVSNSLTAPLTESDNEFL